ncbi:MAG: glycosyltransferase [Candidatus Ventricola sp.]
MSVLHICCNLAGSTVFGQLFEALRDEGLEQTVFVPEKRVRDIGRGAPEGVPTHWARTVRSSDMLLFFRKAQRSVPAIEREIDLSGVRLVHAHTLFTDGGIARALYRRHGIPYVVTLRYSDIDAIWRWEPHLRPMARRILADAAQVVFLSPSARSRVLDTWLRGDAREAVASKSAVIPNGICPRWLDGQPRSALGDPVRVGFAGLMNRRKRPLDALQAVHAASDAGSTRYVLRACGDGPLRALVEQALRPGDESLGRVQGMEAMKRFYAGCDVLLVPSGAETFGMVYLEAMSQGVPVLYTRGQGFDGQFPEGEAGYSVVCGDIAQQAKALELVTQNYARRSARCIELAQGYAWPSVAGQWMALYRKAGLKA